MTSHLLAQAKVLLLAGYETTSSESIYFLSRSMLTIFHYHSSRYDGMENPL